MLPHDELDQLSAYLDGELDDAARTRIDAHLPTCADCRATLEGLRATVADLKLLPDEVPTEQDSWAVRSAIARARRPPRRWQRFALVSGTAAAALIAVVATTHHPNATSIVNGGLEAAPAPADVPVFSVRGNFDQFSAQAHLLDVSGKIPVGAPANNQASAPKATGGRTGGGTYSLRAPSFEAEALNGTAVPTAEIDHCVDVVRRSQQQLLDPVRYELAAFGGKAAFFLFFRTPDRFQLWVMSRDSKHTCDVLFFAQTQ